MEGQLLPHNLCAKPRLTSVWTQVMPAWDLAAQKLEIHDPPGPEYDRFETTA